MIFIRNFSMIQNYNSFEVCDDIYEIVFKIVSFTRTPVCTYAFSIVHVQFQLNSISQFCSVGTYNSCVYIYCIFRARDLSPSTFKALSCWSHSIWAYRTCFLEMYSLQIKISFSKISYLKHTKEFLFSKYSYFSSS